MNKKSAFIQRNLSALTFIVIYLFMVIMHLFIDSFVFINQLELLTTFLPFIVIGMILDFILRRNQTLDKTIRIAAQLLPACIFGMQGISALLELAGRDSYDLFGYLIWLFLAAPFFIASYNKEGNKPKMIYSIIGAGLIVVIYMYLTTKTNELNEGSGAVIYFISYFFMFYAASGIRKLPYLGAILGISNAAALLLFRYSPITDAAKIHGWDYDIVSNLETLLILTSILCILLCFFAFLQKREVKTEKIS